MKRMYLMKGVAALAFGLVAVSCNKSDIFNPYAQQEENQQQFTENFQKNVMDGKTIDANQTWSTAAPATVNVSVNLDYGEEYSVYLFTEDPNYSTDAKYLGVTTVKSGEKASLTIAKPNDVTALYAACVNKKGNYFVNRFNIEGTTASITLGSEATKSSVARRAASTVNGVSVDRNNYVVENKNYWKNDLLNYNNDYEGYYDLSQVPSNHYTMLSYGLNNENHDGNKPVYGDGKHFIVPAGKTVTGANFNFNDGGGDDHVIVVKGTLVVTGDMKLDCGKSIYVEAGGKLEFKGSKLEIANTSRLVNYGTIEFTNTYVDYENGPNYTGASAGSTAMYGKAFYNGGTIKESSTSSKSTFNFAGGGNTNNQLTYYNEGSLELHAFQFNAQATLVNVGHIKADTGKDGATKLSDLSASGQNGKVVNICDMSIKMYAFNEYIGCNGSLLYCETGLMTNYGTNIYLGSQAMIKVGDWYHNGGTCYASTNADDYAVMKITGNVDEQNGGSTNTTQGYLYFDVNMNNLYGKGGQSGEGLWHINQLKEKMFLKTVSEATAPANITIASEENGCNYIGYHEGDGGKTFTPNYVYYAFEDLGTSDDFDFNDVVIRVSTPDAQGNASVELMCAGGTMSTYVTYGTGNEPPTLGSEVHTALGASSYKTMVNTGGETKPFPVTLGKIEHLNAQTDMTNLPLGIKCEGNNGQVIKVVKSVADKGKTPLVIVVSGDENGKWYWPTERTNITTAYPGFGAWGANVKDNADWYKNAAGSVYAW